MKRVLAFSSIVKRITDKPRDKITVKAFFLLTPPSTREPPTTIGKSGKIHGAKTVSSPAMKEINRNNMLRNLSYDSVQGRAPTPLLD